MWHGTVGSCHDGRGWTLNESFLTGDGSWTYTQTAVSSYSGIAARLRAALLDNGRSELLDGYYVVASAQSQIDFMVQGSVALLDLSRVTITVPVVEEPTSEPIIQWGDLLGAERIEGLASALGVPVQAVSLVTLVVSCMAAMAYVGGVGAEVHYWWIAASLVGLGFIPLGWLLLASVVIVTMGGIYIGRSLPG